MSICLFYEARRAHPLTLEECRALREVQERYSVADAIERFLQTSEGPNWEPFYVYDPEVPSEPDVIFEGSTTLPNNSEEHLVRGLEHWCAALSEVRRLLPDAEWHISVADAAIPWNTETGRWDPWHPDLLPEGSAPDGESPARRYARLMGRIAQG